MALERRIKNLENNPRLRPRGPEQDLLLEYEISKERFDLLCVNLKIFYGPPSGQEDLLGMCINGQVVEKCVEDLPHIASIGWHQKVLEHLLQYPHRIAFDLADFGLENMLPKVLEKEYIEYMP